MRRIFHSIITTIVIVLLLGPIARADQSASTQPQAVASPSTGGKKPAGQKTAAATKKQEEQKLKPVVVTATKIEQPLAEIGTTITVVEDSQIESQKIEKVQEVLRQVPGVQVTQTGSPGAETDVSIRGASASQTLVLLDGVEVNAGATGSFDFANLTTDNLDRIEVLRGAGGSLYGSQAIGGVVQLISPEGEGAPKASLVSEGGNHASSRQVGTFSGAEGNLGYSGAVSYFSTEGYRHNNDSSDNLAGNIRLDYHLSDDTIIRGFARYFRSNVSLSNFSISNFPPIIDNPTAHQRSEFMLFNGAIEHHFGEQLVATANAFFVRDQIRINEVPFAAFMGSEVDRIPDEIRGGELNAVYTWSRRPESWAKGFRTLVGFDFKDRWVRDFGAFVFPGFPASTTVFTARRQEYAGYLEQEASFLNGHILATGGFRVDGNSDFGKEVSPSWSVSIPIDKISTTLRGSYSEGFRAPSFNELDFPGFGNPNLKAETSSEYDGGFTTRFGERASITTTYFSRRVHDLIVTVPCKTTPGSCAFGSEAGNAARVDVQGVEIVPQVTLIKGLTFGGHVTVLDETHKDAPLDFAKAFLTPPRPLRVAKHTASALLQYVRSETFLPNDRVTASVNYIFVGDRDDITPAGAIANHNAYHRVDAVVSYALGRPLNVVRNEEVFARVTNAIDRTYSEAFGFKAPPVTFLAGVKLDFE
jgi:vitamin B12 transporter